MKSKKLRALRSKFYLQLLAPHGREDGLKYQIQQTYHIIPEFILPRTQKPRKADGKGKAKKVKNRIVFLRN